MKPLDTEALIVEIRKCKTQKRAFELAALLVWIHLPQIFSVGWLENQFGNALADIARN